MAEVDVAPSFGSELKVRFSPSFESRICLVGTSIDDVVFVGWVQDG